MTSGPDVALYRQGSVNISCTSSGIPVPAITWLSPNKSISSHQQSDLYTSYSANFDTDYNVTATPGSVVSTLHIVNAQYSVDAGEYECIGFTSHAGDMLLNSSAMVTVRLLSEFLSRETISYRLQYIHVYRLQGLIMAY